MAALLSTTGNKSGSILSDLWQVTLFMLQLSSFISKGSINDDSVIISSIIGSIHGTGKE